MTAPHTQPGHDPTLRPCTAIHTDGKTCGLTPTLTETARHGINVMRLECACGNRGATLMFTKSGDRARMKQAAEDGWNLAG